MIPSIHSYSTYKFCWVMAPILSKLITCHHGHVHHDVTSLTPGCFTVLVSIHISEYGGLELIVSSQKFQTNLFSPKFLWSNTSCALKNFHIQRFESVCCRFVFFNSRLFHCALFHYHESEIFKIVFFFTVNNGPGLSNSPD